MMLIVKRAQIPELRQVEIDGETHTLGIVKDFRKHPALKKYLPEQARLSLSWVHLAKGEELATHCHDTVSMIIFTQGRVRSTVKKGMELQAGDIAVIPPGVPHGFIGSGDDGVWGLSLQFEGVGLYENPDHARVNFA